MEKITRKSLDSALRNFKNAHRSLLSEITEYVKDVLERNNADVIHFDCLIGFPHFYDEILQRIELVSDVCVEEHSSGMVLLIRTVNDDGKYSEWFSPLGEGYLNYENLLQCIRKWEE